MKKFDYKSCAVIYNPISTKFDLTVAHDICLSLYKAGIQEVRFQKSKQQGHTVELIQENNDCDLIITLGGDGTVGEAYRAFDQIEQHAVYAHLGMGTTNDMAINFHLIRNDPLQSLKILMDRGEEKQVDTLKMNGKSFAYISAFGYLSYIPYMTKQSLKKKIGHSAYIATALPYLMNFEKLNIDYEIDGKTHNIDCHLGMISNFEESAGVVLHPEADPTDGKFEVLFLKKITPSGFLRVFPQYLKKKIDLNEFSEFIDVIQTDNLKITFHDLPKYDLDNDGDRAYADLTQEKNTITYTTGKKIKVLMLNQNNHVK